MSVTIREHLLIEDDLPAHLAAFVDIPEKTRTVIGDATKYTRHSNGAEQLFDLANDPDETAPIQQRDPARRARGMELLADAMIAADDSARGTPTRTAAVA